MITLTSTQSNKLYQTNKGSFVSPNGHNTSIIDLDTGEILGLQGLPKSLNYDPLSVYAAIKVPGRNNPYYTYTGSEDILEFEISWYSNEDNKQDVLARCKWLEVMTKSDGWFGRNHIARFQWGDLFSKALWIVFSAKYELSLWDSPSGMYPMLAKQRVVLKRYTLTNATHSEISDIRW